jgi:hypothetical protein
MRSETEIQEHLAWLTAQCTNFKDEEAVPVIRQLETLFWVLGHERSEATAMAEAIWRDARTYRGQHPHDHS